MVINLSPAAAICGHVAIDLERSVCRFNPIDTAFRGRRPFKDILAGKTRVILSPNPSLTKHDPKTILGTAHESTAGRIVKDITLMRGIAGDRRRRGRNHAAGSL